MMVDPGGDSVEVSHIMKNNPEGYRQMVSDLETLTGLRLGLSESNRLTYEPNPNAENYSQEAKDFLISAIEDNERDVHVLNEKGNKSHGYDGNANKSFVLLSKNQINGFIKGAVGVNSRTMGYGMTFLHELDHTTVGKGGGTHHCIKEKTVFGFLGETIIRMNKIRAEMGGDYGQRLSYAKKGGYIPFSVFDSDLMKLGQNPSTSYIYAP
jgi:hypothetical protein